MEIPSEIFGFVDCETQNVIPVKLSHDNVSCFALTTGKDKNHDDLFHIIVGENKPWEMIDKPKACKVDEFRLDQPMVFASSIVKLPPTKLCVPYVIVAMVPLLAGVRPLMSVAMSFGVIFLFPFFVFG